MSNSVSAAAAVTTTTSVQLLLFLPLLLAVLVLLLLLLEVRLLLNRFYLSKNTSEQSLALDGECYLQAASVSKSVAHCAIGLQVVWVKKVPSSSLASEGKFVI